jgi:hypothetical protein
LIEEQEKTSKLFEIRSPDIKAVRTLEDSQKIEVSVSDIERVFPPSPRKESQQREVTMSRENENQNGKITTEMKLTENKARKMIKKKAKIEKLQKILEGSS